MVLNMKKNNFVLLSLAVVVSCICTNCSENNGSSSGSNFDNNFISPGKDRTWWHKSFDSFDKAVNFLIDLKNAGKNGDFHFGVSNFEIPGGYERFSTTFSGHIALNYSNKEDILESTYDRFRIEDTYYHDTLNLPNYHKFKITYYPFNCEIVGINFDKTEYTDINYFDGAYEGSLTYKNNTLLKVEFTKQSSLQIDKAKLVNDLLENYKFIT